MIRRRAAAESIATNLGNHSFRETRITAYMNGGSLEKGMANHASTRTIAGAIRSASMRSSGSQFDPQLDRSPVKP
jgi:hypothetical protein